MRSGVEAGALPELVVELGERRERRMEGVGIGEAHARNDVPVVAGPAGDRQRRARSDDVQAALRVEHVGEAEQILLVGPAAVVEDQQAVRLAGGRPLAVDESAHVRATTRA